MHNNGDNDDDGGNDGDGDDVDVQVIDHEEDNLSDKETYSKNIPAIGGQHSVIEYSRACITVNSNFQNNTLLEPSTAV